MVESSNDANCKLKLQTGSLQSLNQCALQFAVSFSPMHLLEAEADDVRARLASLSPESPTLEWSDFLSLLSALPFATLSALRASLSCPPTAPPALVASLAATAFSRVNSPDTATWRRSFQTLLLLSPPSAVARLVDELTDPAGLPPPFALDAAIEIGPADMRRSFLPLLADRVAALFPPSPPLIGTRIGAAISLLILHADHTGTSADQVKEALLPIMIDMSAPSPARVAAARILEAVAQRVPLSTTLLRSVAAAAVGGQGVQRDVQVAGAVRSFLDALPEDHVDGVATGVGWVAALMLRRFARDDAAVLSGAPAAVQRALLSGEGKRKRKKNVFDEVSRKKSNDTARHDVKGDAATYDADMAGDSEVSDVDMARQTNDDASTPRGRSDLSITSRGVQTSKSDAPIPNDVTHPDDVTDLSALHDLFLAARTVDIPSATAIGHFCRPLSLIGGGVPFSIALIRALCGSTAAERALLLTAAVPAAFPTPTDGHVFLAGTFLTTLERLLDSGALSRPIAFDLAGDVANALQESASAVVLASVCAALGGRLSGCAALGVLAVQLAGEVEGEVEVDAAKVVRDPIVRRAVEEKLRESRAMSA